MICLGIESTAHTFGVGIVSDKNDKCEILANEKNSFTTDAGGIRPRDAADSHVQNAASVVKSALEKAGVSWSDVDLISFSQGPGIGQCLQVGAAVARALSLEHKKTLIGVNHCIAHIEIGKNLTGAKDPIVCYASGANTQIIGFELGKYRVYGETLDIGIGNLLDSFGRALGLGFPAGPKIDEMYFKAKNYVKLPYSVKGMDLVFSGLQTAAEQKIGNVDRTDLAYSLMHNAFAMLTEVTERAMAHTEKQELVITGGVAASKALREMMGKMCEEREAKMFVPPVPVCVDNAAMIAWLGIVMHKAGNKTKISESFVMPKQRTDDIEVNWL
ncbi:MAG: UGMP family protein [Candidatus Diapherotrites archaeon]|uniref:tRNA N6-adenosine threonylcarbamoyltransferase n=1 Tax=Candidatus Iainarchaeum sp. TaxID=3101447 RepID=A0A2D6M0K2_9ARCH|nr:UGMP family protein [Candidatus Diapherotrites archaeon]|tara:strand:+ start:473 stop:1459 length:987 start_codon:yes stop_codon:yes gene_type:complete